MVSCLLKYVLLSRTTPISFAVDAEYERNVVWREGPAIRPRYFL